MSSAFRRTLPARPHLDQQKKLAKELLRAFRRDDSEAIARLRAELPDKREITLADAQFVLAREYGFVSWGALKAHIEEQNLEALPPLERFKAAVKQRDAVALRRVLSRHPEVRAAINEPLFAFDSPAISAAAGDGVELIDVLLEYGADPNRRSSWWAGGFHPLHSAKGETADHLIAAGAIPDACAAANLDRPDLLARILADDPARVHERGGDGQTPLHFAQSRRVIDMLLDAGADPDARDVDHRSTPAEWMIGQGKDSRSELARYLVERGASADIFLVAALGLTDRATAMLERDPSLLSLRTSQGQYGEKHPSSYHIYQWTIGPNMAPLQVAAHFGREDTVAVMQRFATAEQRLLLACHRGDRNEALAIVNANPGIVQRLGNADRRALTDEAWSGNGSAVRLMLELGFDPSQRCLSGPTGGNALHCASWEGAVDCVEALLAHPAGRALIDSIDTTFGGTPLSWCSHGSVNCGNPRADHASVARLLIGAGSRLDPSMGEWESSDDVQAVVDQALREIR